MLKKKKLVIGIGILAALAIMLLMDAVKISNEKRPPNPVVMVDGEKVDADLRGYTWHGETQAVKRANAASVTEVKPRSEITVQFGTKDEPESIALDTIYGTDRKKPVYTGTYTLSNKPGPITMRIKAKWEGKGQAEYTVSLDVEEESSYQELLAEEAGEYTVLAIRKMTSQTWALLRMFIKLEPTVWNIEIWIQFNEYILTWKSGRPRILLCLALKSLSWERAIQVKQLST